MQQRQGRLLHGVTDDGTAAGTPAAGPHVARAAREVIELLEVLWEAGRDAAPTAPVSSSQLRVMYILDRDEGINLRTLSDELGAAPSSVSRLCDRLHALGYLERVPSRSSRREVCLSLSKRGSGYLRDLRARREENLQRTLAAMHPAALEAMGLGLAAFRDAAHPPADGASDADAEHSA
ncbi:MarR family winged helix-turn-helix transcriptional regulator [Streptomyces indicus]|uniref:DNA-binding transcriptional regulator, MarR family n=1 Tax=Streptomyces indicus TaxID=417292 RepID=A0A1G8T4P6_9ACTN|nr:MarR family transcriptional regulator [Streptomyces indicus]SDJ36384.1 DNA-binding transcriptional regulator, MarR family [Streptomyces indicus]